MKVRILIFTMLLLILILALRARWEIQVGIVTHQKAKSLLEEGVVPPLKVSTFYKGVRSFFETAVEYSLRNLPHDDAVLNLSTSSNECKQINYRLNIL